MKVLIINPYIPDYRFEIFQNLGALYDLTVLHSGKEIVKPGLNFKQITLPLKRLGPFTYFPKNIHRVCKNYNVIISEANIRHMDRNLLILNPFRAYRWISWGIGVSASYNKKYDSDTSFDWIRHFIFRHADANVFYSDVPIKKYLKAGFPRKSLFVAHNTTFVAYNEDAQFKKDKLLFVGTLYKQKRIYELLGSYKEAIALTNNKIPMDIIGSGPEYNFIRNWIGENQLEDKIRLIGPVFDHAVLEGHFRASLACISPGQAGLSVLTSMGYGTPFITRKDALTGGEIFNITNNVNGILYNEAGELKAIILEIINNPAKYLEMGKSARQYYLQNRQVKDMIKGLTEAIDYVSN